MTNNKVLIIAEAGVNHNGNYDLAIQMIDIAKEAGVDVIKFQTAIPELVMSAHTEKAAYQKVNTGEGESQLEMSKRIHLPLSAYADLKKYCEQKKIQFLSTPFDLPSVELLFELGQPIFKIPSGEITNLPYLRQIGSYKKQIILSTGMAIIPEIAQAIHLLVEAGTPKENITVLHCTTDYPTSMQDVNLRAMLTIKNELNVKVGYSDHTLGIEIPIAAVALGATVIEKHFTLNRSMEGPDHQASLEPHELKIMVQAIRNVELAMGTGEKVPTKVEMENRLIVRKSIHTARSLPKGHIITEADLIMKRPGNGISPMLVDKIIGKITNQKLLKDHLLTPQDLEG
jgi:N-acetylneuraminate synthase